MADVREIRHPLLRWPWSRGKPVVVYVSEGGCACSMLSDDADWNEAHWSLRPDAAKELATGVGAFAEAGPESFSFQALWLGERADTEVAATVTALTTLLRGTGPGTKARYVVGGGLTTR